MLFITEYRLRQKLFYYDTVYNRIILAMFFYSALLKIYVASKILQPTTCTNKLFKKQNSANVDASPHEYLIITK